MTTGVIGAMAEEISFLLEHAVVEKQCEWGGMTFHKGTLNSRAIVLVHSGIGKVNAALCAQILIDHFSVHRIVFTGVAGAVAPHLKIGDVVISTDSLYHDVDATAFGYPVGQIPRLSTRAFPADGDLISAVHRAVNTLGMSKVHLGRVLTGDRFVASKEDALALGEKLEGLCVEMEGAGVGQVCYLNTCPYVLIRAISDQADGTAPQDFQEFCLHAAQQASHLVAHLLKELPI